MFHLTSLQPYCREKNYTIVMLLDLGLICKQIGYATKGLPAKK